MRKIDDVGIFINDTKKTDVGDLLTNSPLIRLKFSPTVGDFFGHMNFTRLF